MRSSAKYSQGTPSARVCGHASAHIEPFPMIFLQIIPPLTHLRRIRRKRGASQCILQVSEQRRSSPHGENTSLSVVGFEMNVYIFPPSTSLLIPLPLSSPVIFVIFHLSLEIQTRTPSTPDIRHLSSFSGDSDQDPIHTRKKDASISPFLVFSCP